MVSGGMASFAQAGLPSTAMHRTGMYWSGRAGTHRMVKSGIGGPGLASDAPLCGVGARQERRGPDGDVPFRPASEWRGRIGRSCDAPDAVPCVGRRAWASSGRYRRGWPWLVSEGQERRAWPWMVKERQALPRQKRAARPRAAPTSIGRKGSASVGMWCLAMSCLGRIAMAR